MTPEEFKASLRPPREVYDSLIALLEKAGIYTPEVAKQVENLDNAGRLKMERDMVAAQEAVELMV
jgi:hypothetical protein